MLQEELLEPSHSTGAGITVQGSCLASLGRARNGFVWNHAFSGAGNSSSEYSDFEIFSTQRSRCLPVQPVSRGKSQKWLLAAFYSTSQVSYKLEMPREGAIVNHMYAGEDREKDARRRGMIAILGQAPLGGTNG
jgi:hypothetical protein